MARHDPPARSRKGSIPRVELDGSVTLYGIEDWSELRDEPVITTVPRPDDADPDDPAAD